LIRAAPVLESGDGGPSPATMWALEDDAWVDEPQPRRRDLDMQDRNAAVHDSGKTVAEVAW
jgi:hypothetical protein